MVFLGSGLPSKPDNQPNPKTRKNQFQIRELKCLNLNYINLKIINSELFKDLIHLETLYLRDNNIEENDFKKMVLTK